MLQIPRVQSFRGEVDLPGSKSIANRALLLSALADGTTELVNLPDSDDVNILKKGLVQLGTEIRESENEKYSNRSAVTVRGCSGSFPASELKLNLGNAGTAMRPLVAVLSACHGNYILDGDEGMRKRPIKDLTSALRSLGVDIKCSENGTPPVIINARGISGGRVAISGRISSQFITALLLAGPLVSGEYLALELDEEPVSKPYIDLTIRMMNDFGVKVTRKGYTNFNIPRSKYKSPEKYIIEGDATAATYFLAAGALPGSGPVTVDGLPDNSSQGDVGFADLLQKMGARITRGTDWICSRGPTEALNGIDVDMNAMPDAALTLAVLALFARGETKIRNIENLRFKESERMQGLKKELEKLGAIVEEKRDQLSIQPPKKLKNTAISTYNDHRMAMAFSLASFGADIVIENPVCVNKTYPGYFKDFLALINGNAR